MQDNSSEIFFSVIIPTYNRGGIIDKTIDSVLSQVFGNYEIIVIDDGSTDTTQEIISRYNHQKIRYFKKENGERGAARNFGMKVSRGEYITFLDSDDILYEDYLKNAFQSICKYKFPPFFHLAYEVRNEEGDIIFKANKIKSNELNSLVKGNNLSCMGIFMNRNIISEYLFVEDRQISGSEDWELWLRVTAKYGIYTDNRISACIVDHTERSVLNFEESKLVSRKKLSLEYAFKDDLVKEKYGSKIRQLKAGRDLYISLHLILGKNHTRGLFYFFKALKQDPLLIWDKRTFAILKRVIFRNSKRTKTTFKNKN